MAVSSSSSLSLLVDRDHGHSPDQAETEAEAEADTNARYEEEHVHQVYEQIASHFSSTRFKPWPVVDSFLRNLPVGSVGLDVGCGNGKYLTVRQDVFMIASDRSTELLKFAAGHRPHDVALADTLNLPHLDGKIDFVISIAVVHHLSTRQRRRDALACILKVLKPSENQKNVGGQAQREKPGQALVFVWALEQKSSRRGWDAGDEQDILVPWVLKNEAASNKIKESAQEKGSGGDDRGNVGGGVDVPDVGNKSSPPRPQPRTFQRYYHLYRKGELEEDIEAIGGTVLRRGYDRDNWWAVYSP